ncbi:MAG: hypothetical protein PHT07_01155 [Paludibacter sp.]|nr:hypothetical protein [Paludibacter sp.]
MKKTLIFTGLLLFTVACFSENYMDKIVKNACECVLNIPDSLGKDNYNMKLGLCLIDVSMPYKKELKRDYDIDLDKMNSKEGEKLGRAVVLKMGSVCPEGLVIMTKKNKAAPEEDNNEKIMDGVVMNIENNPFVVFSIKDDFGRIFKFYWLSFIHSDLELTNNYNSLLGKTIKLTYDKKDYFDPKILDYRQFNVISKIETGSN